MPSLEVLLPLVEAKRYLNIPAATTVDDDELQTFVPAAVERVERHLGRSLVDAATASASERLACKVTLDSFWRTQRVRTGRGGGGGASGAAIDADSGPAGAAPLRVKLTELLGEPAAGAGGVAVPAGSFPLACPWPDPVVVWVPAWGPW